MCLAVPGKIIEIIDNIALIEFGNEKRKADCSLLKCEIGEFVIVSNGMIIDKIPKKEALESLKMYKDAINSN